MSKEQQKGKKRASARFALTSRFWKTFLVVLAAFLIFAGPTYVVYVFLNTLEIDYAISMVSGFVLLMAGLVLIWYLIKNKAIS